MSITIKTALLLGVMSALFLLLRRSAGSAQGGRCARVPVRG
jgi:hypothetical protein